MTNRNAEGILEAGKGVQEHNNWRQIDSMRYERKREEGTAVFYEVLEQGRKAAEFFYAVKPCQTGRGNCQFWIERIHMEQDYLDNSMRQDRSVKSSGSGGFIWSRSVWTTVIWMRYYSLSSINAGAADVRQCIHGSVL